MQDPRTHASAAIPTGVAGTEPPFSFETTFSQLLANVRPLAYEISLVPDIRLLARPRDQGEMLAWPRDQDEVDFKGTTRVCIEIIRATNTITLNVDELVFEPERVLLDGVKAKNIIPRGRSATLVFPQAFGAGRHRLEITYSGKFSSKPQGIYYSDYNHGDGTPAKRRRLLMTQFEATDARRMFPCWDEPAFKATFALSVELPRDFLAISNMPGECKPAGSKWKQWTFQATPKMSSYLVVLVAGELERLDDAQISERVGADVGIVAPVGRQQQGRYALDVMGQVLPYYNDYFGVAYPLPKLDLIAIPDFVYTAMENWGGITYIDNALLFDEQTSTHKTRESVFETIAHEVAHQWSGNLVTMAWWDNLWLNEGFATWMQKKATDKLNKNWKIRLRSHEDKQAAMSLDALNTSKEIHHDIIDDSEADSAFDAITYRKGAALIRMVEDYLGEDVFRKGMRLYMEAHKYSNATTVDLWNALQDASGKDVANIAAGFITQPGIPLIRVEQRPVDGKQVVTLKQEPFSIHGPSAVERHWRVPVRIARPGDQASQIHMVGDAPETLEFDGSEPVKVNIGDVGYYRALYDKLALKQLEARFGRLQAEDRVNLLADSWAMVQAGLAEPEGYLDLTTQVTSRDDLAVWSDVIRSLREMDDLERGSGGREKFRVYARRLIRPVLDDLTWDPKPNEERDAPLNLLLRALAITALGRLGDADVIAEAHKRFAQDPKTLHKELREPVATVVGYSADAGIFDKLRELGKNAANTETRLLYYYALAGAGAQFVERILEIALGNELPTGRVDRFLGLAASASDDPDRVWRAVFERRQDLFKKLSASQNQRLLPEVAVASSNSAVADELQNVPKTSPGAIYEAERATEQIRFKAEFKKRLLPKLDAWIQAHSGG